jgi:HSP20 family protein
MAKKTQSATGQQAQTEPPDQAEQKLPAEQQGGERTRSGRTFRPRVDIRETERGLVLQADVPGARPDGLTITLDRRALNVQRPGRGSCAARLQPSLPGIPGR